MLPQEPTIWMADIECSVENSAAGGYLDASHLKVVLKKDFTLKDKQTDRRDVTDGHDVTDGCDRNTLQDNFKNCDKQSQ